VIIEPTEALTVIDVETFSRSPVRPMPGKTVSGQCEAAAADRRQLKLRNIGGV